MDKKTHSNEMQQEWNLALESSHNQNSLLIALVQLSARQAAENEFKAQQGHKKNQDILGN